LLIHRHGGVPSVDFAKAIRQRGGLEKMIINRRAALAGSVLAAGMLAAALAGPAAAQGVDPAKLRPAGSGTHCVSASVPAGSTAAAPAPTCFGSFADAISFATAGAVRLPAGANTVTQQQLDAGRARLLIEQPALMPSVVLGISYKDTGWTGDSWVHTGTSGCDTDAGYEWQNVGPLVGPGGGWDNAISSASGYSDCTGRYWANSGSPPWGANIDTNWSSGVMSNAASAIQWY
jgi:hypothetical protein